MTSKQTLGSVFVGVLISSLFLHAPCSVAHPRKIPLGAPQLAVGRKAGQPVGLLQSWYGLQSKCPCRL